MQDQRYLLRIFCENTVHIGSLIAKSEIWIYRYRFQACIVSHVKLLAWHDFSGNLNGWQEVQ